MSASAAVDVMFGPIEITRFSLWPEDPSIGQTANLAWGTANAMRMRISADGVVFHERVDLMSSDEGSVPFEADEAVTTLRIEASNPDAVIDRELVVRTTATPTITSFSAKPRSFVESSTTATITWSSAGGEATLYMSSTSQIEIPVAVAPTGTVNMRVNETTRFYLLVDKVSFGSRADAQRIVGFVRAEREVNDELATANDITVDGAIRGEIDGPFDRDFYLLHPRGIFAPAMRVWIEGCASAVSVTLLSEAAIPLVIEHGTASACTVIDPAIHMNARNVAGGAFIEVFSENGESGSYVLFTEPVY